MIQVRKEDYIYNKERVILGRQGKSLATKRVLLRKSEGKFLKIITLHDPRNSKDSKRILFIVLELYWPCTKACVLYLLAQYSFVTVANRTYYITCPMYWDNCILYI